MNGQRLYIRYNNFDEDLASPELRDGICNFILEQLPAASKIQQWMLGSPQDPPPHGAVRGWVKIYKGWHQPPYEHFTLDLEWANAKGNLVRVLATAHVYSDGLETVWEKPRGAPKWKRRPGQSFYERTDLEAQAQVPVAAAISPPLPILPLRSQRDPPPGCPPFPPPGFPRYPPPLVPPFSRPWHPSPPDPDETPILDY